MHKYLSSSLNSVVSFDMDGSLWAATLPPYARFQQKQIEAREEKLVKMYENQQQKAFERVNRSSAGSNTSLGSSTGGGKVRQMFDERRKAGIDKSYPLEPLKGRNNGTSTVQKTVARNSVQKIGQIRNGKQQQPTMMSRTKSEVKQSIYNNNNGKESYQERRFEQGANNQFRDVIEMMNDHNLRDCNIEREEMPMIGFDEPDLEFAGKLANVGGKLPSEKAADEKKIAREALGKTFRKEAKPIVKRNVRPIVSPTASLHSQSNPSVASASGDQIHKTVSQIMSAKKPTPQVPKAPSSAKPSAKQTGKAPVQRDDLTACRFCNRRFASDRLAVHENICGQTMKKRRKAYDATKHRLEGTDLEQYARKGPAKTKMPQSQSKQQGPKKDWRRTHEEFINAIRSAKQAQMHVAKGGKLSDLPPPPPSSNPDYVQCPHCGRKFNEAAAERHIPKCANFQFNKPRAPPKPGGGKHFR